MVGLLLGALLLAALVFIGWKFMQGNRLHNIVTTISAGANTGINQLEPFFKQEAVKKDLLPSWEYTLHYFFKSLGIVQFDDCAQRLALRGIPADQLTKVQEETIIPVIGPIQPSPNQDVKPLKPLLDEAAKEFTFEINKLKQRSTSEEVDVATCSIPIVNNIADKLAPIFFTAEGYTAHREAFKVELSSALEATAADIYKIVSGKDDGDRYMGGGCC